MTIIEEISTITAKGQTTVPKAVRQALGLDYGGKIAYRIEDGRVMIHNAEAEHADPALAAFLGLIEKEIAAGRALHDLPSELVAAMRRLMTEVSIELDAELEGDVAL
jgi:antitoxin PrlF